MRKKLLVLKDEANAAFFWRQVKLLSLPRAVFRMDNAAPGVLVWNEACQSAQQRGLARAGWAEECRHAVGFELEGGL